MFHLRSMTVALTLALSLSLGLLGSSASVRAQDEKPSGPVAAVTHLDKATCPAETLKLLAARRKVKTPAAIVMDLGNRYRLTRWPALGNADDQPDVPAVFVLLEKAGACQLLVADHTVEVSAWHLPLAGAVAPQLLLTSYTGGAHCCFSYRVVSLGKSFAADVIDSADAPISLVGIGDGDTPDITYVDMAFAYWNTDFASSPASQVRLTWDQDRYHLVEPKQQPAPSIAVLAAWQAEMTAAIKAIPSPYVSIADQMAGKEAPHLDPVIWSHLLDLIYAGYPEMAVDLFNKAWPAEVAGREMFWRDFVAQMQEGSVLWQPWNLAKVLKPDLPRTP
jgi:hypothetical protein